MDSFLESNSKISDRRDFSTRARSDIVTNWAQEGGVNLKDIPCSPKAMMKYVVVIGVVVVVGNR